MSALIALETVVLILLVILVAGLLRSHAEILRRLHELGAGEDETAARPPVPRREEPLAPITSIEGAAPGGGAIAVALAGSRGMVLLAFLSSGCVTCRPFWSALREGAPLPYSGARLVVVTKGPTEESPAEIASLAGERTTIVMSSETWDRMQVPASPYFALVDAATGAIVGEGAAAGWERVGELMRQSAADAATRRGRSRGTAARSAEVDDALRRAGIDVGDPSLYRPTAKREAPE